MSKKLKYGQTPMDRLPKKKLLRLAQKMFCALTHSYSVMYAVSNTQPYWSREGIGGKAKIMAKESIEEAMGDHEAEDVYRSFFRMAKDLLFRDPAVQTGWVVCPKCKDIVARKGPGVKNPLIPGSHCEGLRKPGCKGILRAYRWSDLK